MRAKQLTEIEGQTTFALVFDEGDEAMAELGQFARDHGMTAAHFTGIGAFRDVVLGWFDWERKEYRRNPVREQVEVASLAGDVALRDGEPQVHAHVVVGDAQGRARAGHLLEGHVRPTLEVILTETPAGLHKQMDPESGLALIAPEL